MRHHALFSAAFVAVCAMSLGSPVPTASAQAAPAAATTPEAKAVADRVQAFYDQTRTFQADFSQHYVIRVHQDSPKDSKGRVVFQKPGKMSWKYDQPNGNRVVSDGQELKVYEQENQQVFVQQVQKSQFPAALSFLMGQGQLTSSFTLRLLNARDMHFESGFVLEGVPTAPTPAYQKVLLYVDGDTAQVRRVLILDAQGNKNRFDFENAVVNTPVPASEFTFTPPAGTQIVKP
ncbi:MAG TPA: outer membrane lipoprotein carrier protein LolA [Polyangiaceae bacterium]|nr:outer membrane lipoprotein carrier protein LolA [Polyangiaceae bacterium]